MSLVLHVNKTFQLLPGGNLSPSPHPSLFHVGTPVTGPNLSNLVGFKYVTTFITVSQRTGGWGLFSFTVNLGLRSKLI